MNSNSIEVPSPSEDDRVRELKQRVKQAVLDLIDQTGSCAFLVDLAVAGDQSLYLAFGSVASIHKLLTSVADETGTSSGDHEREMSLLH